MKAEGSRRGAASVSRQEAEGRRQESLQDKGLGLTHCTNESSCVST
jgi:hypothetical protein